MEDDSMGSIRPLITITILAVVGAYLYVKINEGPVQTHVGATNAGTSLPRVFRPWPARTAHRSPPIALHPAWPSTGTSPRPQLHHCALPLRSFPTSATNRRRVGNAKTRKMVCLLSRRFPNYRHCRQ